MKTYQLQHIVKLVQGNTCFSKEQYPKEHTLIITDHGQVAFEYQNMGYAVVGVLQKEKKQEDFSGLSYLIEDYHNLDQHFLSQVFARKHHIPLEIIKTPRCKIREITIEDVPLLYEIYNNPLIYNFLSPLHESIEEEIEYTKDYIKNQYGFYGFGMWIIEDLKTNEMIGRAGVEAFDDVEGVELGYFIRADYQRKGYATEICNAIITYIAKQFDIHIITTTIEEKNVPSIKLCEKLGFVYEKSEIKENVKYKKYKKQ